METSDSLLNFTAAGEDAGKRLDRFLSEKIADWSRSRLQKLIDEGDATVNEKAAKSSYKLRAGDEIEVELTEIPDARFEPENIPLDIVYEDEFLAVINKPAGMIIHPGAGVSGGTLANAIAYHFKFQISDAKTENRIGIVHRLDKDTSGLIVVAKDEATNEALSEQFRRRKIYKSYVALIHGAIRENVGKIEAPIGRAKYNRLKMSVTNHGREALSLWRVRQRFEKFTLLEVEIKTGRTHQIRVHLAYLNHPIIGDETYNEGRDKTIADAEIKKEIEKLGRFFLHAEKLAFTHPKTRRQMDFYAPLPAELERFLETIRGK